jgi:hypothetical protein
MGFNSVWSALRATSSSVDYMALQRDISMAVRDERRQTGIIDDR